MLRGVYYPKMSFSWNDTTLAIYSMRKWEDDNSHDCINQEALLTSDG
jgi:hypothetical protein